MVSLHSCRQVTIYIYIYIFHIQRYDMNFCAGFDPPTGWCPKNCWVYGGYIELTMATMGKPST